MPRQLLLEGPAIEPLLAKVREEHGTAARIVKAERVRVGGVGGFFAKVRFEVTIEVPEAGAEAAAPALPGLPGVPAGVPDVTGLDALLAAAEDAERSGAPTVDYSDFWAGLPLQLRDEPLQELPAAPAPAPAPAPVPAPRVPVAVQAAPAPALAPAPAPAPTPAPTAASPVAPELVGLLQEAPLPWTPPPAPVVPPAVPPVAPAPDALTGPLPEPLPDPLFDPLTEPFLEEPRPAGRHRAGAPAAELPAELPVTAPSTPAPVADAPLPSRRSLRQHAPADGDLRLDAPSPAATAAPQPPAEPGPASSSGGSDLAERLEALGVHRRWLRSLPGEQTGALRELATRLGERPATPRRTPDAGEHPVVVVLAESGSALPTARTLALRLGLRADEVVVLADDAPAAADDLDGEGRAHVVDLARQRRRPVVVLLAVPVGADAGQRAAARGLLASLGVDQLWAVVDATRRTADVEAWLRDVAPAGGVDAVSLVDTAATAAPAAGLDLSAPVVLLDGRPATPAAWVSMLAARLTEDDLGRHLGTS